LTPIDIIRSLRDGMDHHADTSEMKPEEKERIIANIAIIKKEFDENAKREVQSAFVHSYEDTASSLAVNYLANVDAFTNRRMIVDPVTDEESGPDERLMRGIEEQIGITETAKKEFRGELMQRIASKALRGERFKYEQHPRLREAIEKKLFSDLKDVVKMTTNPKVTDEGQQRRLSQVQETLKCDKGYCDHCSGELIRYVGNLLSK
jgi:serine protein kinase